YERAIDAVLAATKEADPARLRTQISELRDKLKSAETKVEQYSDNFIIFETMTQRLEQESGRLGRDSWINLFIGMIFAAVGVSVLLTGVINGEASGASLAISSKDIARMALGVFVNIVAFFFFRLYLVNQTDIRHNKNELTTIEMRIAALR